VVIQKWLLQEDGLYIPVLVEKSAHPFVSSMIHLSSDKPVDRRPGVTQTWGMIATLIRQQEQLNVPQGLMTTFKTLQAPSLRVRLSLGKTHTLIMTMMMMTMMMTLMTP
jgi:hypothetical protein